MSMNAWRDLVDYWPLERMMKVFGLHIARLVVKEWEKR